MPIRSIIFAALLGVLSLVGVPAPLLAQTQVVATCGAAGWAAGQTGRPLQLDANGNLCIGSAPATPTFVQGNVASGVADSGNPVKVGCIYNSTQPGPLTNGMRVDCQSDTRGNARVTVMSQDATTGLTVSNNNLDAVVNSSQNWASVIDRPYRFNGTTWDRAFTCPLTAVVNVTAAATTEIVALSGSTVIYVCGFSVSMSAAGTAQFVYGTGTNCGTGTTSITGAVPLATGTPWTMASGTGSALRGLAANALCVAAVTGNVVGFINYVRF